MSAVIRLKRLRSEVPEKQMVLNCKKRKTNDSEATAAGGETSTVLKFAGTVAQDTNISEHIAKLTKDEAKDIVQKKRPEGLKSRIDQNREKSQQNRFKIVNYTRALNDPDTPAADGLTIVDVEKDNKSTIASTSATQSNSYSDIPSDPYVYDIYIAEDAATSALHYPDTLDFNDLDLSILEYNDYLYSRPRLVNSDSEDDSNLQEDEDSNDENNCRNDYPDEDEMSDNESIGEREMRKAMNNFEIGNDLSSDDEQQQNGFVYSIDSEAISFEDDLDYCDVNRYGEAYARYKKRVVRELEGRSDDDSDADDEEERYSEDEFAQSD